MKTKQIIGVILAVVVITATMFMPVIGELSQAGIRTIGMLVAFLLLLITEALPVVVVSLIFCAIMPLLGVTSSFGEALKGYSEPIVFFTLASFGIATALTTIPISKRLLRMLLRVFGKDIKRVSLAIMICCSLFSSVVSNVPTCAIFMVIALDFLKLYDNEDDRKKTARMFMIAMPVSSMIGGMMTPAGSSINLITISQLEAHANMELTFVQWMAAGIPLAVFMLPIAWFIMLKIYKPAEITKEQLDRFIDSMDIPEKMDKKEIKVCIITIVMLFLWITSSWIKEINVMIVAMLGCCVMFLPGIEVLNVKTFIRENSWDAFFLVGCVISIANAMINNGVSAAIANNIPVMDVGASILLAFIALIVFIALVIIPVASSMIPIMAAPLIAIAIGTGQSPALIMLTAALCAGNCYLLPLDTVPLITYSKGYYSMIDMIKSTAFLQIIMIILCAFWLPFIGNMLGIA